MGPAVSLAVHLERVSDISNNDDKVFDLQIRLEDASREVKEFMSGPTVGLVREVQTAFRNLRERPNDALGFLAIKVMANQEEVMAGLAKALTILIDVAKSEKDKEAFETKLAEQLAAALADGSFTKVKLSDDLKDGA